MPNFFTRVGVQCKQLARLRTAVKHTVDMQWRYHVPLASLRHFSSPVSPDEPKAGHILRRDLVQQRMPRAGGGVAEVTPVSSGFYRAHRLARYWNRCTVRRLNRLRLQSTVERRRKTDSNDCRSQAGESA